MKTSKKYTVILSAFQTSASYSENLAASAALSDCLINDMRLKVVPAVGHYKGAEEISFIIHTNSARAVYRLKAYLCKSYRQENILVSSNKHALIELHSLYSVEVIGTKFVSGKGDGENYTRITSTGDYWSVA